MNFVHGAVDDADVLLYVTDTVEQSDRSGSIIERINHSGIPTIVVINKIDITTPAALEALVEQWQERIPEAIIIPCSAKEQVGMKGVLDAILERLPEGEASNRRRAPLRKSPRSVPTYAHQRLRSHCTHRRLYRRPSRSRFSAGIGGNRDRRSSHQQLCEINSSMKANASVCFSTHLI